ncbi:carboxylesterase/lipase family protein [Sphingomonas hengshuiensis]|uniref:Carboxylic ester hydrolase n=1 Tax=Sphingomonas hengshuiensis TaxID=1609977 RepID=A0A7U5BFC5_9SPHN|nr:carboxylesterase family protein [Sphingomonas hengshuiensis]AJP74244.1 carboxylesterase [Sphingomonas hengshuiensis]
MTRMPIVLAATALALLAPVAAAQEVKTDTGSLAGTTEQGVASWKGIPFAAAPIGPLRWRAPQPAAKWSGVRAARDYGNDCMQVPFPSDAAPLGTPPAEDCLYANVWKPTGATGKLPVIFWIYGGGFVNGGASPPTYSGAEMAKKGVVFVSANYRVGRFGTFAHPQLTREDPDKGLLGNYGFLDQIAALHWVQRNIAAFGGDPDNVTIIGESAGGMSVHTLVTSPLAKGLFHRAVAMSGGNADTSTSAKLADVERIYLDFAASKGIAADDPQALAKLRALSAEDVTDGLSMMQMFQPKPGPKTFSGPFVDGRIEVDQGTAYGSGAFARVPMLIGATSADMGGKSGFMIAGARSASARIAQQGVPVWHYRFSYVADSVGQPGAQHATDIPFFFDTQVAKYGDKTSARDNQVGKTVSAYIVNFARTGDPNGAGLHAWPRYDPAADVLMDFSAQGTPVVGRDPWGAEIDEGQKRLAAATASGRYNSLTTPLGTMLDDPAAKAVLQRHIPQVIASERIAMARGVTLTALQSYMPQLLTDALLKTIDGDLASVPVKP